MLPEPRNFAVQSQRTNLQDTIAQYRQTIAHRPDSWDAHYHLGLALQQQGHVDDALTCYQTALALNAECGDGYLQMGKIYQTQKRFAEAVAAYRQGLKLVNPHYAAAIAADADAIGDRPIPVTPLAPQTTVTVGVHSFPALLPVLDLGAPRPFWTVVIPVYNRVDYLLECLASVLAQWSGETQMEIIVIDDASSISETLFTLVMGIGGGIVTYYRNAQSLGLPGNWNAGLSLSRGQWIHLLHDDDYPYSDFYQRLQQHLQHAPEQVGAAFTGYENIDETGHVVFAQQLKTNQRGVVPDFIRQLGVFNPLNMPAVVIRRQVHEQVGLYHPVLTYTSDWELYKRIAAQYDWWYEPELLACYRQHAQSKTAEMMLSGTQVESIRYAIELSEGYLPSATCTEITQKSRSYYFDLCLRNAVIPLRANNLVATWRLLKETLKIDQSPAALSKLFNWLATEEATPLRNEIASWFVSLSLNDSNFDKKWS